MRYHFIYMTTNVINDHLYIGKHSTNNPEDGYIGSGKDLEKAIKEFGLQAFVSRPIICALSEEYAYELEREIVTLEFAKRKDTYNRMPGGYGCSAGEAHHMYGKNHSLETRMKMSQKQRDELHPLYGTIHSEETKAKMSNAKKGKVASEETRQKMRENNKGEKNPNYGNRYSEETLAKLREINGGENNPAFGKKWITDGSSNRRISINEQPPIGWRFGKTSKPYKARGS